MVAPIDLCVILFKSKRKKSAGEKLHIHHGYIGVFLIVWSVLTINFGMFVIGEFNPWLAWSGLVAGAVLVSHDVLYHLRNKKKRR